MRGQGSAKPHQDGGGYAGGVSFQPKRRGQRPVDYTFVKNIRKTGGLRPGMVLYDIYETAYVTPDEAGRAPCRGAEAICVREAGKGTRQAISRGIGVI